MNKKLVYTILVTVGVFGLVVGAIMFLNMVKSGIPEAEAPMTQTPLVFSEEIEALTSDTFSGAYSLLLIGSDSREGQRYQDGVEGNLNDVTMLLKVDETHQRADIISFPRDAIIPMGVCTGSDPSGDYRQMNTGLTLGGPDCVKHSVENLTGETVDGVALVSFDAVESLTKAVGGVPVCVAEPIVSQQTGEILFEEGENLLSGAKALDFVRERYGFGGGGDLGRVYNQQVFLKAFLKEFRETDFMANPTKFWVLADATLSNLQVSDSLNHPLEILKLTNSFLKVPEENYQFHTVPVSENAENQNRLTVEYDRLAELIKYINTAPTVPEPEQEEGTVSETGETDTATPVVPEKPETLPDSDEHAAKTEESHTVTVCG